MTTTNLQQLADLAFPLGQYRLAKIVEAVRETLVDIVTATTSAHSNLPMLSSPVRAYFL